MVVDVIAYDTVVVVEQSSHMDVEMGEVDVEVEMMRFGDVIHTFHEEQLTEDERHFGVDHCHLKKEKKTAYVKKKWAVYLSLGVVVVVEEVIDLLDDEEDDAIAAPEEEKDKHKNVVGVIAVVAELEEVVVVVVAADVEFDALYKTKAGVVE